MLNINHLSFSYGKKSVFQDFSLQLQDGEILSIMGASGCGKSTLLQLTSGLLKPDSGSIETDSTRVSYAFQEPRLFPWLTVKENLAAVLPKSDTPTEQTQKILSALQTVELEDCANLYPDALSGGMKSRISLARALVYGGDLFLLDEPFAALDEALRLRLGERLRQEIKARGASAILVTHQPEDAERIADRIITL